MKKMNSLQQLRQARVELKCLVEFKEKELGMTAKSARDFYSPANLIKQLVSHVTPLVSLAGLAIDVYDRIMERINAHEAARPQQSAPESANPEQPSSIPAPESNTPEPTPKQI